MKTIKRVAAFLLSAVIAVTSFNLEEVKAASVIPYSNIEYNYSASVTRGSYRYMGQNTSSKKYHSKYWGSWGAKSECMTCSMSMALSFLGLDITPKTILDKNNGRTVSNYSWGGSTPASRTFADAWDKYASGKGTYSPPIIHLTGSSCGYSNGHYVPVVSKLDSTTYQVLDPWCDDNTNPPLRKITIKDGVVSYYLTGGTRFCKSSLSSATQYYYPLQANEKEVESVKPEEQTKSETAEFILTAKAAANITETSANVAATYTNEGALNITMTGYKYGTDSKNLDKTVTFAANIVKTSGTLATRTISGLKPGTTYYYQPIASSKDREFAGNVKSFKTAGNAPLEIVPVDQDTVTEANPEETKPEAPKAPEKPAAPKATKIASIANATKGLVIKWEKVSGATGYYVYRKNTDGTYKKIKTVSGASTVSYNDTGANTSGNTYSYKVYAYKTVDGVTVKSSASAVKSYVRVGTVSNLKLTSPSTKKLKVTYKAVSKASGYQILYSAYSDYSKSKTVNTTAKTKTLTTAKKNRVYYVKVRAKLVKNSKTYYGVWTKAKVKVK